MGFLKQWSPLEALTAASMELPRMSDESLLKSLGIDQSVVNRVQDALYAAEKSGSRADNDVFVALVEARNALDKAWVQGEEVSTDLLNEIDDVIHRGHLEYVAEVAAQSPKAHVGDWYDNDSRYASALLHLIPDFEYPDWSWKTTLAMGQAVAAREIQKLAQAREEIPSGQTSGKTTEVWRFENGFVDDALYYAEGQRLYEAAIAVGKSDEASDIAGRYNLAYQKELSGFTLESYALDWDDAHRENILRNKAERGNAVLATNCEDVLATAKDLGLVNVDAGKVSALLETGDGPNRGLFVGKIVGIDVEKGMVFQATGRGDGVVLPLDKLSRPVIIGELATISFKDGRGTVEDRVQSRDRGR